ncbi:phosphate acyltransferase PlsX [Desulfofundulus thermocisternus]|uniref:phosphate acyltransferase PlsX n=1 Tax=Desulfofundulus thermocisternus TaxID=42471 RepID=UPI0019F86626|nr:phosphate acyltransferase PlsX [Desulfofundulus thermocisternus]MBE3585194.1 phosphate acyltransferase PlsX [Thermoanaerobacter sp.]MCS5696036.1 phosphate acyltransferase PlsX [Desulfofundulus thermocisternus]
MKIAVDAMGGDHAPGEIVRGAVEAAREYRQKIILVGDQEKIMLELGQSPPEQIEVFHAPEVIAMGEHPAVAVRKKKQSSIVQAVRLVREGEAVAVVSAGSTGAAMAASLLGLGRIQGIDRPAIASILPRNGGATLLIDAGANVDCKPQHLLQFAIMGSLYAEKILGIPSPRVGLLNVGEEETKGNELTLAALPLLRQAENINFTGNVEGRDIFAGTVDVVVCDGFVGNIVLKAGEGLAIALLKMIKEEVTRSWLAKMGTALATSVFRCFEKRIDYAEYGGAPLLGVNGVSIICHGSSTARAIKNAIKRAREAVEAGLVDAIKSNVENTAEVQKVGIN